MVYLFRSKDEVKENRNHYLKFNYIFFNRISTYNKTKHVLFKKERSKNKL